MNKNTQDNIEASELADDLVADKILSSRHVEEIRSKTTR